MKIKKNSFFRIILFLTIIVLLLTIHSPTAISDGIPLVEMDLHSNLRENRQLAFIYDNGNGTQTLNLFLSVSSLYPNENFTIVIPLRTKPTQVNVTSSTDKEFLKSHNYPKLENKADKYSNFDSKLLDSLGKSGLVITSMQGYSALAVGGFGVLFLWTSSLSGDEDSWEYEGLSISLHNFNTSDKFKKFYESLDIPKSGKMNEIAQNYFDYNILIINGTTKPPINEEDYNNLLDAYPDEMNDLKKFVMNNTFIEGKGYDAVSLLNRYPEFHAIWDSINLDEKSDFRYSYNFEKLVNAIYGYGEMEGYEFSLNLPLWENKLFFPLGTTPAWSHVSKTEIIFVVNENKKLDISPDNYSFICDQDNNYYWYSFQDEAPNFDLEGTTEKGGFSLSLKRTSFNVRIFIYDYSILISILLVILFHSLLWFIALKYLNRRMNILISRTNKFQFSIAFLSSLASYFLIFTGMVILFTMSYKKQVKNDKALSKLFCQSELPNVLKFKDKIILFLIMTTPLIFLIIYFVRMIIDPSVYKGNPIMMTIGFIFLFSLPILSIILVLKILFKGYISYSPIGSLSISKNNKNYTDKFSDQLSKYKKIIYDERIFFLVKNFPPKPLSTNTDLVRFEKSRKGDEVFISYFSVRNKKKVKSNLNRIMGNIQR